MFDPHELITALSDAQVRYVVIGGFAVGAHGFPRATKDLDVVPAPDDENISALAGALRRLDAHHLDTGAFDPQEFPFDPLDPRQLSEGGNFLLTTRAGRLDVMQWVPGIEADQAYDTLAAEAIRVPFRGVTLQVCSLAHLRLMKETAGRPQDLVDLENLPST
jgi:hypothetical protein